MVEFTYEENAHEVTVKGWACKTCNRWFGNNADAEHIAIYCCATSMPCDCGERREKPYTCCEVCRSKLDLERYEKLPQKPWDGKAPICTWRGDDYFFCVDSLVNYLEDVGGDIADVQLELCEPVQPPYFEMHEFVSDAIPTDGDCSCLPDTTGIDKQVNDWISENGPWAYEGAGVRPTLESVLEHTGLTRDEVNG